MQIVLDSNVLIADPWLRSQRMRLLLEHAERMSLPVVLLEAVEMEVRANVHRQFSSATEKIESALRAAERVGLTDLPAYNGAENADGAVIAWEMFFKHTIQRYGIKRAPLDPGILSEVLRRATERIPPCSASGKEVRDAIIWLSLIHHLESNPWKEAVFISLNTLDFADQDKIRLRGELADEARVSGLSVMYFPSVDLYNAEHAVQYAHLNSDWVARRLEAGALDEIVSYALFSSAAEKLFQIDDSNVGEYYTISGISEIRRMDISIEDPVMVWDVAEDASELGLGLSVYAEVIATCERTNRPFENARPRRLYHEIGLDLPFFQELACHGEVNVQLAARVTGEEIKLTEVVDVDKI